MRMSIYILLFFRCSIIYIIFILKENKRHNRISLITCGWIEMFMRIYNKYTNNNDDDHNLSDMQSHTIPIKTHTSTHTFTCIYTYKWAIEHWGNDHGARKRVLVGMFIDRKNVRQKHISGSVECTRNRKGTYI